MSKFRLVKPYVLRADDHIKVVWVEHQYKSGTKDETWNEWAAIEVRIQRKDWLYSESKIEINWSAVGAVTVLEAESFANGLKKAVEVAKKEEKKLLKSIAKGELHAAR